MKRIICKILEHFFSIFGTLLALYVGGYLMFIRSVGYLYNSFILGSVSKEGLIIAIICIFFATTVIGFIWCLFDIIAGIFRDNPRFKDL